MEFDTATISMILKITTVCAFVIRLFLQMWHNHIHPEMKEEMEEEDFAEDQFTNDFLKQEQAEHELKEREKYKTIFGILIVLFLIGFVVLLAFMKE